MLHTSYVILLLHKGHWCTYLGRKFIQERQLCMYLAYSVATSGVTYGIVPIALKSTVAFMVSYLLIRRTWLSRQGLLVLSSGEKFEKGWQKISKIQRSKSDENERWDVRLAVCEYRSFIVPLLYYAALGTSFGETGTTSKFPTKAKDLKDTLRYDKFPRRMRVEFSCHLVSLSSLNKYGTILVSELERTDRSALCAVFLHQRATKGFPFATVQHKIL
jgi:hypothetical protein